MRRAKPAPDLYLAAAALVGVPPADCLAVEDAPNGVRAACAAGMHLVAVTTSFAASVLAAADVVVDSLSLLPLDVVSRHGSWLERLDVRRGGPLRKDCRCSRG